MESTAAEPVDNGFIGLLHEPRAKMSTLPERDSCTLKHVSFMPGTERYGSSDELLSTYTHIVKDYSLRQLGDPRDGLNAITGIMKSISEIEKHSGMQFLWGLPVPMFDVGLLWQSLTGVERSMAMVNEYRIPSWSWAAWFNETAPLVVWDIGSVGFSRASVQAAVKWYTVQQDGTSRLLVDSGSSSSGDPRACGMSEDLANSEPPKLQHQPPKLDQYHLHFQTMTTTFRVGPKLKLGWGPLTPSEPVPIRQSLEHWGWNQPFELLSHKSDCIGHVWLPLPLRLELGDDSIDFVFLSYGRYFDDNANVPEHLKTSAAEHEWAVVNCMMISRDQQTGVA